MGSPVTLTDGPRSEDDRSRSRPNVQELAHKHNFEVCYSVPLRVTVRIQNGHGRSFASRSFASRSFVGACEFDHRANAFNASERAPCSLARRIKRSDFG